MRFKPKSNIKLRIADTLINHAYAGLIPRPHWNYIGASRTDARGHRPERAFAIRPSSAPGQSFIWSMSLQGQAVAAGFFLHRSGHANAVNIIAVDYLAGPFDTYDGYAALAWLERMDFEVPLSIYWRALRFIKQQDQFGYSGAWDKRVQFWSTKLTWYREWRVRNRAPQELSAYDERVRATADKRRAVAIEARKHSFASHIKRNFILKQDHS